MSTQVYCGSETAIKAATTAYIETAGMPDAEAMTDALIAMHHPDLGVARSVCLKDVLDALEDDYDPRAAAFVRRRFADA